jgi:hypothetical protein
VARVQQGPFGPDTRKPKHRKAGDSFCLKLQKNNIENVSMDYLDSQI